MAVFLVKPIWIGRGAASLWAAAKGRGKTRREIKGKERLRAPVIAQHQICCVKVTSKVCVPHLIGYRLKGARAAPLMGMQASLTGRHLIGQQLSSLHPLSQTLGCGEDVLASAVPYCNS